MFMKQLLSVSVIASTLFVSGGLSANETTTVIAPWDYEYLTVHEDELSQTETNRQTLEQIFKNIFAQDWAMLGKLYADNYVQHNPDMRDGKEGVIELFKSLNYEKLVYQPTMSIAEGPYIVALSKLQFASDQPEMAVVDINFIREGKSREHWDIIMPTKGKNAAGRTLFESAITDTVKVDRATVNANKQLVANVINEVFNRKQVDKIPHYFSDTYYQHGMGKDGYESVMQDVKERFTDAQVDIKRIVAENDLVLAHSRLTTQQKDFSRVDIWRVRDNKLVEHWAVMQPVPDKMQHRNGMF